MSFAIPVSFVDQFSANVYMLAEQKVSRLQSTVRNGDISGEAKAVERIGGVEAQRIIDRHGDTPLNSTPHSRRWMYPVGFDVADLIDTMDRAKLLIDPQSAYTVKHAGAMGRAKDRAILAALGGIAAEGHTGGTPVALPSEQKILVGGAGLTVGKLLEAKKRLDAAEIGVDETRHIAVTSQQISDLLEDDKVTSSDFNTVKALVAGTINQYLGFTFHRTQLCPLDGTGDRLCYAYVGDAVEFGTHVAVSTRASERPDKRYSWQIYTSGAWGATRLEDVGVVEIACDEPA